MFELAVLKLLTRIVEILTDQLALPARHRKGLKVDLFFVEKSVEKESNGDATQATTQEGSRP